MISLNNKLNNLDYETYSSDSEEDEYNPYRSQVIDGNDSECEINIDDGYDSDTIDTYKPELDFDINYDHDIELYKAELFSGIDLDSVYKQINDEWDQAEQNRLIALQEYKNKFIEKNNQNPLHSESDNEIELLETLPYKDSIDANKIYTAKEIDDMRNYKYYKLANIFDIYFYTSMNYKKLLFAFKNDITIDDNQCLFMLRDILTNKFNTWDNANEGNLIISINRKTYSSYDAEIVKTKWSAVQKLAKELHPPEYANWQKENLIITRQLKSIQSKNAIKYQHSVYQFLIQYRNYGDIKASVFYERYVAYCNNGEILSKIAFGKLLNKHGIATKRTNKLGYSYLINLETIELWNTNFLI